MNLKIDKWINKKNHLEFESDDVIWKATIKKGMVVLEEIGGIIKLK